MLVGVESLTASERRVAELAADGRTNREIAQSLFVTARTVEGHLTNVFRKLDLDSRDQLRGAIAPVTAAPNSGGSVRGVPRCEAGSGGSTMARVIT
jgi:DNA-binding CsgD family transcriptional regulator